MNDQILSIVIECQKGMKEFREYLELCIVVQEDPIRAARILRYLDIVESGEILSPEDFSFSEHISHSTFTASMRVMLKKCFYRTKNYSAKAKYLLLKMYLKNQFEFFQRYVFTPKEGVKK
jgi:hypothetical protein